MGNRNGSKDVDIAAHLREILITMEHLCELYDQGHKHVAYLLASEIHKFLTAGQKAMKIRGDMTFTTRVVGSPVSLMPMNKLIISAQPLPIGKDRKIEPHLEFFPAFEGNRIKTTNMNFRDWWNRDIIYRAGSSKTPAGPLGEIPLKERLTYNRRTFIELVRNKLGAHLDSTIPEELDLLVNSNSFGIEFGATYEGSKLSTADGTLPIKTNPAHAMVRQITHELIQAIKGKLG